MILDLMIFTAIAVLIGLSTWAGLLWRQVFLQQRRLNEREQSLHQENLEAIVVLSKMMLENDMNPTETCLRLRTLLQHIAPELCQQDAFRVIEDYYQRAQHFNTHENRKNLPKQQRMREDLERMKLEQELEAELRVAVEALGEEVAKMQKRLLKKYVKA